MDIDKDLVRRILAKHYRPMPDDSGPSWLTPAPNGLQIPDLGGNSQLDTDGDGDGNLCDADLDNTGFVDFPDLTLFQTAFFTADPDADFNGDAFVDFRDLTIFDFSFFQAPGPSCVDLPGGCTP